MSDQPKTTDEEILAVRHLGTAKATKRLGYATKAAYLRRLAEAEKRAAEAAQPQQEKPND